MKFLITMTDTEGVWDSLSEAKHQEVFEQMKDFTQALTDAGKTFQAIYLEPRTQAKTIRRSKDGSTIIIDGPYDREAKEYMGGACFVIDADSMDEAVEWGRRGRFIEGANEVRQISNQ